ncbi:MAG: hypothetical protein ACJAY4_001456, partial [Cryomorphaceae bacterium]
NSQLKSDNTKQKNKKCPAWNIQYMRDEIPVLSYFVIGENQYDRSEFSGEISYH